MIILLTATNEVVPGVRRPRGVRRLTVHQVVNFGAGRGLTVWAIYSTKAARRHRRYSEALSALVPCLYGSLPADVELVAHGSGDL